MASHTTTLKAHYPWISTPLIASAPMRLISTAPLAIAVTRAGGLGFLAAGTDLSEFATQLSEATTGLQTPIIKNVTKDIVPIGVGFICWGADLSVAISVIESAPSKPAVIWLFAPKEPKDLVLWSEGVRKASKGLSRIWIQVGTVEMAVEAARDCKPDVLVIQGVDAGGHGLSEASSIVTLLPECADALEREGYGHIPLIAAGGIVDGRGVVAALALGASGVCMGTRFLASPEAVITRGYRDAVLKAKDGGVSTARTTVYDEIRGTPGWPLTYDGRGVVNKTLLDSQAGMPEEENKRLYKEAVKKGDEGWGEKGRMTTYAGTGVGLINEVVPAGEILREVLRDSKECLTKVKSRL